MPLQTEFEFELPIGYVDPQGNTHRRGSMRLATAMDEITPLNDPRVKSNEAYLVIILLARVVTRLEGLQALSTVVIENLFAADLAYLQSFYTQINETGRAVYETACPHCGNTFEIDLTSLGEG
jgi:hypothetical protein